MRRDPIMMIDWNGPYQGESVPTVDPRKGNAFYRSDARRLRGWEVGVIIAAAVFAFVCLVWAQAVQS